MTLICQAYCYQPEEGSLDLLDHTGKTGNKQAITCFLFRNENSPRFNSRFASFSICKPRVILYAGIRPELVSISDTLWKRSF